jgi:uncharacterized RDD family membrane protein YckC
MQQRNRYEPPHAQPLELEELKTSSGVEIPLRYAGFWRRFLAFWIDAAILLPLFGLAFYFSEESRMFYIYSFAPRLLLGLFFNIYLVRRYGGTPGKLILKTRITLVDGSPVTTRAAILRYFVLFVLSALSSLAMVMSTLAMTDEMYLSLGFIERMQKMEAMAPSWDFTVIVLTQVWIWGEFVTLLFNRRRRAVQDYIAGTVVVRTAVAEKRRMSDVGQDGSLWTKDFGSPSRL